MPQIKPDLDLREKTLSLMATTAANTDYDEVDCANIDKAREWLFAYKGDKPDTAAVAAAVSLITGFPTTARLSPHHLMNDDIGDIANTAHRILNHIESVLDEDLDETIEREAGGDESQREHYSRFRDACNGEDDLYQDVHIAAKVLEWAGNPYTENHFG